MKTLKDITLVVASSDRPQGSLHALRSSMEQVEFGKVKFFTDLPIDPGDPRIEVVKIPILDTGFKYNIFTVKEMAEHIDTSHMLIVQYDGYVLNGSAWEDEFLAYDYIGAPWFDLNTVGNGGFSLRSTRLMRELKNPFYHPKNFYPEDVGICRIYRKFLEAKGMTWAPVDLATRFSVENHPYMGQFGWHGREPFFHGKRVDG